MGGKTCGLIADTYGYRGDFEPSDESTANLWSGTMPKTSDVVLNERRALFSISINRQTIITVAIFVCLRPRLFKMDGSTLDESLRA